MWELGVGYRIQLPCVAIWRLQFLVLSAAEVRRCVAIQEFVGEILGFRLTGGHAPTLSEINGGKLCVDAWGKQPPSYAAHGAFDLSQCATIANDVPYSIGFRWGSNSFDVPTYALYASKDAPTEPMDLNELFYGNDPLVAVTEHTYTCAIYMGTNATAQAAYPFRATDSSTAFGFVPTDIDDGPGIEVCFQRWTLLEFFRFEIDELWFCYMKQDEWPLCQEQSDMYVKTGWFFYIGLFIALAVISFTLPAIPECSCVLLWLARALLNWELGLMCIHYLLAHGYERDAFRFFGVSVLTVIVLSTLVFLPYQIAECFRRQNAFGTFYLMIICISPTVIFEHVLAYERRFPMMIHYQPTTIGAVGFFFEVFKHFVCVCLCVTKSDGYDPLVHDGSSEMSARTVPASSRSNEPA